MTLHYEFDVADPAPIYTFQPDYSPQTIQGLNRAHPKLNPGSFLGGRLPVGSEGVR
jgi:hypothetical protein